MINHVSALDESIENRDLTVLTAPDNSKWLFQFRKFTVACTYAPGYDYAEFASNQLTIKVRSHAKCIVNRDSHSDGRPGGSTDSSERASFRGPFIHSHPLLDKSHRRLCF